MVTCGNLGMFIDVKYINLIVNIINIIKIAVPVILVIVGMLDLLKAVMAKGDDIKKGIKTFFSRLISAALVYFIIPIVELLVSVIAQTGAIDENDNCISCFTTGECKAVLQTENGE